VSTLEERRLVEALRARDEAAFARLVEEYTPALLRIARLYVPTRALAEEVVQEAWLGVLRGIDGFEGRSSLKTWIFRILVNTAKTRGVREARSVPFSSLARAEADEDERSVDPDRFAENGAWLAPPPELPEERLLDDEARGLIDRTIAALPPAQATVITMRDVEGFTADEVRNALDISETNQRVLLHRARSKVRQALEEYFAET
jgi:RNA polymerase sigma-70 factor (ECF subfamily)